MDTYFLARPSESDLPLLERFRQEFFNSKQHLNGGARLADMQDLSAWLAHIRQQEKQAKPNRAPSTTLVFKRQGQAKIIGIVNIRHHIELDYLRDVTGHIGYSIAPSEQGQGLAKRQLAQALEVCKDMGLDRVLVTCATWNTASRKTILAQPHCHFDDKRLAPDGDTMERYWIDLPKD
ncbi:GNAT family N-acetyltransferase [Streptococcus himalayensis]|uniref:GNAT family acetyltransferase n=1 Tax=Streptococcus himalayensis TaxID=1888195 RepID=A0A917EEB1_9STRE|nr:GNAT family N-acetyltransferase [Streptococcus himalayensis]GGE23494.1 GNAT family acetyltransferase [Streptococcus himalayensis]